MPEAIFRLFQRASISEIWPSKFGYREKSFRCTFARFPIKERTLSDLTHSVLRRRRRRRRCLKEQSARVIWILDISYVARYLASRHCECESAVKHSRRISCELESIAYKDGLALAAFTL